MDEVLRALDQENERLQQDSRQQPESPVNVMWTAMVVMKRWEWKTVSILKKKIQSKIQINVDVDENQRLEKSQRFFLLAILLELVHVYILRCSKVRTA